MRKILEIEPLEEPEMSEMIAAVDLGTLYHNILRDFYNTLIEERYFTTSTKKNKYERAFTQYCTKIFHKHGTADSCFIPDHMGN